MEYGTVGFVAGKGSLFYAAVPGGMLLLREPSFPDIIPVFMLLTSWQGVLGWALVVLTILFIHLLLMREWLARRRTEAALQESQQRLARLTGLEPRFAERTHELTTLVEVSHSIGSTLELEPLLLLVLDQLKKVVAYSGAAILLLEKDKMVLRAQRRPDSRAARVKLNFSTAKIAKIQEMLATQQAVCVASLSEDRALTRVFDAGGSQAFSRSGAEIRSWMGIPLIVRGKVIGMLSLSYLEPGYYEEHHAQLAQAFANHAAIAMHNADLFRQAQETAVAGERSRIARELHDSVTQAIYSVTLYADATRLALEAGDIDIVAENLKELRAMAREAMLDMRLLIFELRPPVLEEEGLVAAVQARLEAVEARSGVDAALQVNGEKRLSLALETELYRIAQEALTNVDKHAQAGCVLVTLNFDEANFCLEIKDDGIGFDTAVNDSGGMGLHSIQERVEKIGGQFQLESSPGEGTTLRIIFQDHYLLNNGAG